MWAVAGRTSLCLVRPNVDGMTSATCTPIAHAIDHGVALTTLAAPTRTPAKASRTVVGIVPDHTRRVRVVTPGFATATALVTDNTFAVRDTITDPPQDVVLLH
jgi:hypothetical protein